MVNSIWAFFIIIGTLFALFTGKIEILNNEILESTKISLDMVIKIFPVMALWLGIMNIAKDSGLLNKLSKLLYPLLKIIFPEIPKDHETFSYISSSIIANMFGLGNAATPLGLKTMNSLQEINNDKKTASNSMITFLVITTSGVTIVPTTVIVLRKMYGSTNPSNILIPCILVTFISLFLGLLLDRLMRRKK